MWEDKLEQGLISAAEILSVLLDKSWQSDASLDQVDIDGVL